MTAADAPAILRRAHMSDSATIRTAAARIEVELEQLAALLDSPDPDGARQRARLVAALRAERFTAPARTTTL